MDLHITDWSFTWSNLQEKPIQARLYKVLVSSDWETHLPFATLFTPPRTTSDHTPFCLDTIEGLVVKRKNFHFEKMWLEEPECQTVVKDSWDAPVDRIDVADVLSTKLGHLRKVLHKWEQRSFGMILNNKKPIAGEIDILEKFQEHRELSQGELAKLKTMKSKFSKFIKKEEVIWSHRA